MGLSDLPTLAQVAASRAGQPNPKPASRLQVKTAAKKLTVVDAKTFKREVRERDRWHCRKCGRKVAVKLARDVSRAEVHHIHGRRGDLRFESRAALLLCLACHEQCTGRVNEKYIIVPTTTFTMPSLPGQDLTDARAPVTFERVA